MLLCVQVRTDMAYALAQHARTNMHARSTSRVYLKRFTIESSQMRTKTRNTNANAVSNTVKIYIYTNQRRGAWRRLVVFGLLSAVTGPGEDKGER